MSPHPPVPEPGSAAPSGPPDEPAWPTLAVLRAAGAARIDPVRFLLIEALARRAAAHEGALRQRLEQRLAQLLAACTARVEQARQVAEAPAASQGAPASTGPLAALVQRLDQRTPAEHGLARSAGGAPAELKTLSQFRSTWARLQVDRQLNQSLQNVPENPGPLNSQRLVLRALQQMQAVSPAYLDHFVSQVETLLWLESAGQAPLATAARPQRRDSEGKHDGKRGGSRRKPG